MRPAALALLALLATGCAAKPPVIEVPLGAFAFALGAQSMRIEQACARKELSPADCTALRKDAKRAKALLDAPQPAGVDWGEVMSVLFGLAAKAAL